MIVSFKNEATENIYNGKDTKKARKLLPKQLWKIAQRKLDMLDSAVELKDLKVPPSNRFEALSGDRDGQYSISINMQYRICFIWKEDGVYDVEIVDYHK